MKRIFITFLFLAIVFVMASVETGLVSAKADAYISIIENTDRQMRKDNFEEAIALCKQLEEGWEDSSKYIDLLLIHDYVDNIEDTLARMRAYAENGSVDMYFAESAQAKKELAFVKEGEYPSIENIL